MDDINSLVTEVGQPVSGGSDRPEGGGMEITLATSRVSDNHHVTITFPSEDKALEWIEEHKFTHAIAQAQDHPIPDEAERILDILYPRCDHGLSAHLCADPINHYPLDLH